MAKFAATATVFITLIAISGAAVSGLCNSDSECDATSLLAVKTEVHRKSQSKQQHNGSKLEHKSNQSRLAFSGKVWNHTMAQLMGKDPYYHEIYHSHREKYNNFHVVARADKLVWLMLAFFCGACGFDRCYLGYPCCGLLKCLTCGGCMVVQTMDTYAALFNAVLKYHSLSFFFMSAVWEDSSIEWAFIVSIILWIFHCATCCCKCYELHENMRGHQDIVQKRKSNLADRGEDGNSDLHVPVKHHVVALAPAMFRKQLRSAGLVSPKPTIPELNSAFTRMDKNGDGQLNADEVHEALDEMGISDGEARNLIAAADKDGDGMMSRDEFMQMYGFGASAGGAARQPPVLGSRGRDRQQIIVDSATLDNRDRLVFETK
jgi:hypothetical protein